MDRKLYGGHKPSMFIVGAQKSGTSSLFHYLNAVPGLVGSQTKEMGFFDKEYNYRKGAAWYESHFIKKKSHDKIFFESTPEYLYRRKVPNRIYKYNPKSKIVIILREPVSRAYSAWNMYKLWSESGRIPSIFYKDPDDLPVNPLYKLFFQNSFPSFIDYIKLEMKLIETNSEDERPGIIRYGLYLEQIKRYQELFGPQNILILGFKDLTSNPLETLRKAAAFAFDSDCEISLDVTKERIKNKRSYAEKIGEQEARILQDFYTPHNTQLLDYLGYSINW